MTQSLYFSNTTKMFLEETKLKTTIAENILHRAISRNGPTTHEKDIFNVSRSRITFFWRERKSMMQAESIYPFANNKLLPDIAFSLTNYKIKLKNEKPKVDILFLMRKDKESVLGRGNKHNHIQNLLNSIHGREFSFQIVDWTNLSHLYNVHSPYTQEMAAKMISLGKIVIVDRLHGSIFSYLYGKPFIFLDQLTGKITNTFDVAFNGDYFDQNSCNGGAKSAFWKANSLKEAVYKATNFLMKVKDNFSE